VKYNIFFISSVLFLVTTLKVYSSDEPIDRFALINRHNVILHEADALAPMTVGNGDFAYTADVTGMQSLGEYYYQNGIPLETLSTWAWHSFPNPNGYQLEETMKESDFHGRKIKYASIENSPAAQYFRMNPHPIALGQISLIGEKDQPLDIAMIKQINQKLDIWKGVITSNYIIDGQPVTVETVCHPELSLIAFKIKSPLLKSGKLKPAFRFPYSYDLSSKNKPPLDWSKPDRHQSEIIKQEESGIVLKRTIDTSLYYVNIHWKGIAVWEKKGAHEFCLNATNSDSLLLVCEYTPELKVNKLPSFDETKLASELSWKDFWTKGGAVDLSGSTDKRAPELERRIILSQYLVKVNYSGSFPPQETGLAHISWYGKHNSEVYWIHAAQFYQWNHTELLENGLKWYRKILPLAQADAKSKGFEGSLWPKMAGYDGRTTPGGINPFIIWNQPNPIYLCELVYRAHPDKATLDKYSDIVFESARFLASYAFFDAKTNRYILGPPIKSVNESSEENNTQNPSFELAQWYYGLKVAQNWRERLGMGRDSHWDDILNKLSPITIREGKYVQIESEPDMYSKQGGYPSDMLMALGYHPQTSMVDKEIMKNTFSAILQRNGLSSFVSWSLGKAALTAARLGYQQTAVDIVCNDGPKSRFNKSGYVPRPKEGIGCPAYLPVNSSFLAAVGLMAAGWDDAPSINAPGFPQDGTWKVKVENMQKLP